DHRRRPSLRAGEDLTKLCQHAHLPRWLPAIAEADRRQRRQRDPDAGDLARGHHGALPADAGELARALLRRLGPAPPPRLRRSLPPALGLLPELLRGRLPRAADRRRPGPLREAVVAMGDAGSDGGAAGRGGPLLLIHGLGASGGVWDPVVPLL